MINNIKSVATFALNKDKSNIFSNVLVKDGNMTCQNELTGISVKVESDIDFCCNAERLKMALANCDPSKMKLNIKSKRLYISSGRFKSDIALVEIDSYPLIDNSGDQFDIQPNILNEMNSITQFTDPNDVRMALQGVALTDGFIKATNGHVAIKKKIDSIAIDEVVIPTKSIQIMAKMNNIIKHITVKSNMVFFIFDDGYLFTKTIDQKMPDIDRILSEVKNPTQLSDISDTIKRLAPLCPDRVIVLGEKISNRKGDSSIDGFDLPDAAFNVDYMQIISDMADVIDFSVAPKACPFESDDGTVVGAIVGIRL